MSLAAGAIRLAARLLPRGQREVRHEEWSADLEHCAELEMTRRQVVLGAWRAALIDGLGWRTPLGRSRWLAAGSITIALAVLSVPAGAITAFAISQLRGVVTIATDQDGTEHEVHWKGYPGKVQHEVDGYREIGPEAVLTAPSAEQAWEMGRALLAEIESSLSTEFGLEWEPQPSGAWDYFAHPTSNGYGGSSLLVVLNAPAAASTSVPEGWAAQRRAIDRIAEVAARHGYGAPVLDFDQPWFDRDEAAAFGGDRPETAVIVPGVTEGPVGQWLAFSVEDPSKAAGSTDAHAVPGWAPRVTLMWGAILLPADARDEFRDRLGAFDGYPRPEPLVSD